MKMVDRLLVGMAMFGVLLSLVLYGGVLIGGPMLFLAGFLIFVRARWTMSRDHHSTIAPTPSAEKDSRHES